MEKLEKVLKGFGCCVVTVNEMNVKDCNLECPYFHEGVFCKNALHSDGKKIIQKLESIYGHVKKALCGKENATPDELLKAADQLKSRLAQAERERDAAIKDLSDNCRKCRFINEELENSPCKDCFQRNGIFPWSPMVRTKFDWRGICPENTEGENADGERQHNA